jgi:hypothetical protein
MIATIRATGAVAIATVINPGKAFQLESISIHLSAAGGAGNLTATINANAGAAYDTLIMSEDMTTVQDLYFAPERPILFEKGDTLDIAWANAGGKTYGLEVKYSPL